MFTREQAEKELKKFRVAEWDALLVKRSAKFPGSFAKVTSYLTRSDGNGEMLSWDDLQALEKEVLKIVADFRSEDRLHLFKTLFPGLENVVEGGWQLFNHLAIHWTGDTRTFRFPGIDSILLPARIAWLSELLERLHEYPGQDLVWHAAWGGYVHPKEPISVLLAAAMDIGGKEGDAVFEVLCASARGEHAIGCMGVHVVRTLLLSSRVEGWEFVEKLLLAAQREEGLRQSILESVDGARPEAFIRLLKLIMDENLVRFSSTVRAVDVWLGYKWDSEGTSIINKVIEKLLLYFTDPSSVEYALEGKDPEQAYLALWSLAFSNASACIKPAQKLLKHTRVEFRFVAVQLLSQVNLPESWPLLFGILDDENILLPYCAVAAFQHGEIDPRLKDSDLFERLEKVLHRFPEKKTKAKPLVWPWTDFSISQDRVSSVMINVLGKRDPVRLIPHLANFSSYERSRALEALGECEKQDARSCDFFIEWLGDGATRVAEAAFAGLQKCSLNPETARKLEKLLSRTSGPLRKNVIHLLLTQSDLECFASGERLIGTKNPMQRQGGLEILVQLFENKRCVAEIPGIAATYRSEHCNLTDAESAQLQKMETVKTELPTLDDALGLIRHEDRTWPEPPSNKRIKLHSQAAVQIIVALDDLIHQHRDSKVAVKNWDGEQEEKLLGDAGIWLPEPNCELPLEEDKLRLPLSGIWIKWWEGRGADLRDSDGFELVRACAWYMARCQNEYRDQSEIFLRRCKSEMGTIIGDYKKPVIRYPFIILRLFNWILRCEPKSGVSQFVFDALESCLELVPHSELERIERENFNDCIWRYENSPFLGWLKVANLLEQHSRDLWTNADTNLRFKFLRWIDQPFGPEKRMTKQGKPMERIRPSLGYLLSAHRDEGATDADVLEQILGVRNEDGYGFDDLDFLTRLEGEAMLKKFPATRELVEKCRARVLEVELARGEMPSPATGAAFSLQSVYGVERLTLILRAMKGRNLVRGANGGDGSRESVFSHLLLRSYPLPEESSLDFKKQMEKAEIPETQLVELAVYSVQWASLVEQALGWTGLTEAVWWIHAHTKSSDWSPLNRDVDKWKADLNSHTELTPEDLMEGAVDVAWFQRVFASLGEKRWLALDEAAKYASTGVGHTRARLFAKAMLGKVSKQEIMTRIKVKRHQDSARALGLLPLASGNTREKDVLERYKTLQEFIRSSRQFGSQRQASEKRAAQLGQANLARTAGYPDPLRLQWAMEAREVADLAEGPISATVEGITVSLGIDHWGEVQLNVARQGKAIAEIPAKLKKDKVIAALRERKTELKRQGSRIRIALEQLMCRGETVTGEELLEFMRHPLLSPMLAGLVLVGDGISGYPVHGGKALESHDGRLEPLKRDEKIRIAHPLDLMPALNWHSWQKDCFAKERIQPFKQVFRELYPMTKTEIECRTKSERYAGHQVQPRKALSLLGARGWIHHAEEGVRKNYHEAGVTAWLEFSESFYTPAEVEGLTLEAVRFTRRGQLVPVRLKDLSPRLFSETMRDIDLIVSVAHRGGVDPEASASTVQMRASLVHETCALLRLSNVRIKDTAVLIKGELSEYSIHLGSAIARKLPGGTLFIVAVQAQHRGRLFLPFADNDPRTSEIISKVLLLSRDKEIKDPSILSQILS